MELSSMLLTASVTVKHSMPGSTNSFSRGAAIHRLLPTPSSLSHTCGIPICVRAHSHKYSRWVVELYPVRLSECEEMDQFGIIPLQPDGWH